MLNEFLNNITGNQLISKDERILLAVSGGIDSMSMASLFIKANYDIAIAHCNFKLRNNESDGDQVFVEKFASNNNLPFHTINFDTNEYAALNKISVQMAARELRYSWFNTLALEHKYDKIAIAHNSDDIVETFLINLTRGTGIKGLTGIKEKSKNLIRPLLFATRSMIEQYVKNEKIEYREDSSNASIKYMRNAMRHTIIPKFKELNPSFSTNVLHTIKILKAADNIFNKEIEILKRKILKNEEDYFSISIKEMKENKIDNPLLYGILSEYGFSSDVISNILECLDNQPGAEFYSNTYRLIKDRDKLLLQKLKSKKARCFTIRNLQDIKHLPIQLQISSFIYNEDYKISKKKNIATFDLDKVAFPLTLRNWEKGDFFYPFGMKGRKKLSDFFSDNKFSVIDKENTWLLASGEDILWVLNHRPDNRFRVSNDTKEVLQIEMNI